MLHVRRRGITTYGRWEGQKHLEPRVLHVGLDRRLLEQEVVLGSDVAQVEDQVRGAHLPSARLRLVRREVMVDAEQHRRAHLRSAREGHEHLTESGIST